MVDLPGSLSARLSVHDQSADGLSVDSRAWSGRQSAENPLGLFFPHMAMLGRTFPQPAVEAGYTNDANESPTFAT